jgi:carotenoid cleavage dioxygenase-like enzyme
MPSPIDPTNPPSTERDLDVRGTLPLALTGRLVGIGRDGFVHSFNFDIGRVSYLARSVGMGAGINGLVAFEGSVLAYGEDSSVRQLNLDVGTLLRVDLAGPRRTVATCPKYDPDGGELHFVARDWAGAQMHVVVPPGALTRRSRLIVDARARIQGLAIGSDHVVFVADGVAGVAPRDGELRTTWMPTDVAAPWPVHTYRAGDTIILLALTPSLERWILHPDGGAIEREVLDPTPRRFFPGDFVVVPDATRPDHMGSGWFVGLVHDPSTATIDLRVSDATDITEAIATIRIPRPIPQELRCAWMPYDPAITPQQSPSPKEDRP